MKVRLTKRVVTPKGKRFCAVYCATNNKMKPDWVVVGGKPEHHPEGRYFIDWVEKGRRIRQSVGALAGFAQAERARKEAELEARKHGVALAEPSQRKTSFADAVHIYLDEIQNTKKRKTWQAYSVSLRYLLESCPKTFLQDVDRSDLIRFLGFLRMQKNQSPRSCANKFENVMTFFKAQGVKIELRKTDWPDYVENEVEVYEKEELDKLMAASTEKQRLCWWFLLTSGLRDQEMLYLNWSDINFEHGTVTVSWKKDYNWSPKQYRGREVPLPSKTLEMLKKARPENGRASDLVFPTAQGNPNGHLLRTLKRLVLRVGMDPERFWLHKFRSTFATWHLRAGVDLPTVQRWMGHTDLASTMRYLKPSRSEQMREKVEAAFA